MDPSITVVIGLLFSGICAAIASSRGRSIGWWAVGGFFLGLIGMIILLALPKVAKHPQHTMLGVGPYPQGPYPYHQGPYQQR